jgi:hypothetical protein
MQALSGIERRKKKMKMKTKQRYFNKIKSGEKLVDYRDAHITFVNEETGGKYVRKVVGVRLMPFSELPVDLQKTTLFGDDMIIAFELEKEEKKK